ncbi:MAG: type 4a pilus biogenesis protein PilO [Candidatus Buchananbacteria bacterium]
MTIRKKIIISIIIILSTTFLIIYLIILPTVKDILEINKLVYAERVDLEKKYERGQLLRKTIEDFQKIKPQENRLISVFVIESKELEFITTLEKISNTQQLDQKIYLKSAVKTKDKEEIYDSLPVEIAIKGNFTGILKYLNDLEKLNYYFNISTINIGTEDGSESVSANLKGKIYILANAEKNKQ